MKIDRSFVHRGTSDKTVRTMYDTCLGLARQLKMSTVAEGVEDDIQLAAVRKMRCDEVQGYLISRPMPLDRLKAWLSGRPVQATGDNVDSRLMPWWSQSALASFLDAPIVGSESRR